MQLAFKRNIYHLSWVGGFCRCGYAVDFVYSLSSSSTSKVSSRISVSWLCYCFRMGGFQDPHAESVRCGAHWQTLALGLGCPTGIISVLSRKPVSWSRRTPKKSVPFSTRPVLLLGGLRPPLYASEQPGLCLLVG